MKKIFRYIFFCPLSFIIAIIVSGTISVLQNVFNYISCNFSLVPAWFLSNYTACNGVYNKRTFLADVAFFIIFIQLIELFIPSYKKQAKLIATVLLALMIAILLIVIIAHKIFNEDTLNSFIILIGLIAYTVVQIKDIKKNTEEDNL